MRTPRRRSLMSEMATQGIYNNLKKQLDFCELYENDSLRKQHLKSERIGRLWPYLLSLVCLESSG